MRIGVVGLGRMGANIAQRLMGAGHECVVYDRSDKAVADVVTKGASGARDLDDLISQLGGPRAIWVMLPAGAPTEETIAALADRLSADDVIMDGGNTFYRDDIRRAKTLQAKGLHYVDVGTSGGVWGLERGYCLMIGGEAKIVERLDPIFKALAPGAGTLPATPRSSDADPRPVNGYIHAGPVGAGHFVKMVHNGIEYGLMQAYAEGFDILMGKGQAVLPPEDRFDLNLADVAEVWRRGSVISSWLLDLTAEALAKDGQLSSFTGEVADSGEGRWTVEAAMEQATPADVLATALFARFRSRQAHSFADKLLSAMRFGFGGHVEIPQ